MTLSNEQGVKIVRNVNFTIETQEMPLLRKKKSVSREKYAFRLYCASLALRLSGISGGGGRGSLK